MAEALVVRRRDVPHPFNVVGEKVTVLAAGSQTGSYEIFHQKGPEGSGPPPHSHPWDEAFYVVQGEVAFGAGKREFLAEPGTLVHLPAGTVHWFRFGAGGAEMISMTSREGASHMFADLDREISPLKPDLEKLAEVATRHGVNVRVTPD